MVSPTCGLMGLQKACIITGSIEIVLAGLFLLYNAITLASETPLAVEEHNNAIEVEDPYRFHAIRVVLCGLNSLYWITGLFMGLVLTIAAKQRDLRKLRSWFITSCILTVIFMVDIFMESFSMRSPVLAITSPVVGTVLTCYMLWIVMEFMDEVSHGGCAAKIISKTKSMEEDA
jgi:FtsH-binding integral membrane protein